MKKLFLIIAAFAGFQLSAQVKSIEGLKLTKVEEGVFDFRIPEGNDRKTYELVHSLADECQSYIDIPKELIGETAILGYYFFFENHEVIYLLYKGGRVSGSVIEKKKGA
jgi:hypothetical protein